MQALNLGGLNVLEQVVTLNAEGEPETQVQMNQAIFWGAAAGAAIVGGIVLLVVLDDDDESREPRGIVIGP